MSFMSDLDLILVVVGFLIRTGKQDTLISNSSNNGYSEDEMMVNLSHLRQLTTGFNKISTYKPWRRSLEGFDTPLYTPVTVLSVP